MNGISYFTIHLLAMLIPGWVLVRLFGFAAGRLIFIFAGSYIYFSLFAALGMWLNLPLNTFFSLYGLTLIFLAGLSLRFRPRPETMQDHTTWLTGLLVVIATYWVYRSLIGPYTEVPADLFRHLEFAQAQLKAIHQNHLGPPQTITSLFNQKGHIWYSFFALITSFIDLKPTQTLPWATLANGLIFLSTVYTFAWYIFTQFKLSATRRLAASLLATLFLASHLGLNVFAYIRYYTFAPTILNMVVYFATLVAIIELLKWQNKQIRYGVFILFGLTTTAMVHSQEALFILIMGGLILAWFALYPKNLNPAPACLIRRSPFQAYRLVLLVFVAGFFALVVWTYFHENRPEQFFKKIIQFSRQGPILNRILYLNPGYQGYQVITLWGLFVYALFVLYWRKFVGHPYLFAGMLVPFTTVFNPIFVDWFMRIEGVHTLWRMLFLVPIHFVAGLVVIFLFNSMREARAFWRKGAAGLAIIALFALLLPLSGLNPNSRMTLQKVPANNSYTYWQDLIDYLNQYPLQPVSILTDPVTGYVLKGLTRHHTYHHKFFSRRLRPFNFENYDDAPLAKYKGWLLVLNDRDGGISQTGVRARHWPGNILKTSKFYSEPLREHIRTNPGGRFEKIWEQDKIYIYKIH